MSFNKLVKDSLILITCDALNGPYAVSGFTTRRGGVSQGHLSELNLSLSKGDRRENVLENYRILGNIFGFSPEAVVGFPQVHGDDVCRVTEWHRGVFFDNPQNLSYDAMVTDVPCLPLFVYTADCTPTLLYDPVIKAVGAVHAGWRGTAKGLVGKTVREMVRLYGSRPEDIRAAIGPAIGTCCFETDEDVPLAMSAALGGDADAFIQSFGGKWYVDLKGVNRRWLLQNGLKPENIEVCDACTACAPELFWSHRRHGENRGSLGSFIMLK